MKTRSKENPLLNILCNVVIPSVILLRFSNEEYLGPLWGFLVALLFPIGYGVLDIWIRKKWNFFSILGVISILLTGGIGLLQLSPDLLAIKEAFIPLSIGMVIFFAEKRFGFAEKILLNEDIFYRERIQAALATRGTEKEIQQLLRRAAFFLSGTFFVSAGLNFFLARFFVQSPAGTVEFAEELGMMTAMSYPVIVLPNMIALLILLFIVLRQLRQATGLTIEEMMTHPSRTNER